jgi:uncharacterized protein (DUF1499 family)
MMTNLRARRGAVLIAVLAAVLAGALGLLALLAPLGSRWGLWHYRTGFRMLGSTAWGAIGLAILSAIAMQVTRPSRGRPGLPYAVFGMLVAILLIALPVQWRWQARRVPPIHDITTDTRDPPQFVAIAPLRADAPNPVEYDGPDVAAQQREAYPDIRPLALELPPDRAFTAALEAAEAMRWEIVAADAATGRIEATDRTFWFGFRDDIVIRLTSVGARTIVDVRSKSRVGRSDMGTNAQRIRTYLQRVEASAR